MIEAYFPGPMPNNDFFQAVWQFRHDFVDRYAGSVRVKEATIHIVFCDERDRDVNLRDEYGKRIRTYTSPGAYHAAADFYDAQTLEPQINASQHKPLRDVPFSPI